MSSYTVAEGGSVDVVVTIDPPGSNVTGEVTVDLISADSTAGREVWLDKWPNSTAPSPSLSSC